MLSKKIETQITLIAYATVSNLFATFHNPKMRGDKFTWEGFPSIAEGMVATQVFMNVVRKNKGDKLLAEEYARKVGHEIAESMVRQMLE